MGQSPYWERKRGLKLSTLFILGVCINNYEIDNNEVVQDMSQKVARALEDLTLYDTTSPSDKSAIEHNTFSNQVCEDPRTTYYCSICCMAFNL